MAITQEQLAQILPGNPYLDHWCEALNKILPDYDINTPQREAAFLAQCAHESDQFKTLEEYASGAAYEGRKDLGNTHRGDGVRYKGRGIFQLTGRANYKRIGDLIGMDLENNPELAESPEVSVLTALEYWRSRGLNVFADRDDVRTITYRINGGYNGLDDRINYLKKCKQIIPQNIDFKPEPVKPVVVEKPADPINPIVPPIVVAKKGDNSPYVKDLQDMLIKKGAKITADGSFGSKTEQAVKDFQTKNKLKVTGQIDTDTLNRLMV